MAMMNSRLHQCIGLLAFVFALLNTFQVAQKLVYGFANAARIPQRPIQSILDDKGLDELAWFVHVSDLHFSIFQDFERSKDFLQLCQFFRVIQPQAIVLTGDLTDAKAKDKLGSRQFEAEWKVYKETMEACGAFDFEKGPKWLDVRGNHDTFNTRTPINDFYSKYGIQRRDQRTYMKNIKVGNITYSFVALDATLSPGPKRPFNFFGSLSPAELQEFQMIMNQAGKSSDYQIAFGHYPSSCILSPSPGLKAVIGQNSNTLAYLCGHLHTLNGMAPHMYSTQPEGFLELEVGDWKDNRIFRLMAVDHGQLVFKDTVFSPNNDTLALVLNPMDMTFVQPITFEIVETSTHIRALIFSSRPHKIVEARIDANEPLAMSKATSDSPLYVAKWSPEKWNDGEPHTLEIIVDKTEVVATSRFALSPLDDLGTTGLLPKIVLYFNWSLVTQSVFGLCAASIVLPLCYLRQCPKYKGHFSGLSKVAANNSLFYSLVFAALYISLGPWALGYFLDDDLGLLFPWGLWIDGNVLPADVTHLYGLFFMFPYFYILILGLAFQRRKRPEEALWKYLLKTKLVFAIVMVLQVLHCIEFYLCYGTLATIFGTCGLGRVVFVYYLCKHSCSI